MTDATPHFPGVTTPHPGICPTCGLSADNALKRRSEQVAMATYVCTNGHLFTVTWMEATD